MATATVAPARTIAPRSTPRTSWGLPTPSAGRASRWSGSRWAATTRCTSRRRIPSASSGWSSRTWSRLMRLDLIAYMREADGLPEYDTLEDVIAEATARNPRPSCRTAARARRAHRQTIAQRPADAQVRLQRAEVLGGAGPVAGSRRVSPARPCWCAARRVQCCAPKWPSAWSPPSPTVGLWRSKARAIRSAWTIQPTSTTPSARSCWVVESSSCKDLVRRLVRDVFNGERPQTADEVLAPTFVNHNALPGTPPGPEGTRRANAAIRMAFPDWSEHRKPDRRGRPSRAVCRRPRHAAWRIHGHRANRSARRGAAA